MLKGYLTSKQVAERLEIGRQRIGQIIREGAFPGAIKLGRDYFIPQVDVDEVLAKRDEKPCNRCGNVWPKDDQHWFKTKEGWCRQPCKTCWQKKYGKAK